MEKILGTKVDLRVVVQYSDCSRLYVALNSFRDAIVIFASSMRPDLVRVTAGAQKAESRLILIAENGIAPTPATLTALQGVVYRNISEFALLKTVRQVIRGERSIHPIQAALPSCHKTLLEKGFAGTSLRDR